MELTSSAGRKVNFTRSTSGRAHDIVLEVSQHRLDRGGGDSLVANLKSTDLADALRELGWKIEIPVAEPTGLGAVVKAGGRQYVRLWRDGRPWGDGKARPWLAPDERTYRCWDEISGLSSIEVLSEGVTSDA